MLSVVSCRDFPLIASFVKLLPRSVEVAEESGPRRACLESFMSDSFIKKDLYRVALNL